jgi:inosine-uridine nucleoside N-ribohydrolase
MCRYRAWLALAVAVVMAGSAACGAPGRGKPAAPAAGRVQVVIDTDMSSDDIMALDYLLVRKDISIRAITVAGTGVAHGQAGATNVLRLMRALGVDHPVSVGYGPAYPTEGFRSFPPAWRSGADAMYGLPLPRWSGQAPRQDAVSLLIRAISRSPRPVTVITLGPLTDLALALRARPSIARNIAMVYAMAGAFMVAGNEPVHRRAEWNVYVDANAAVQVLRARIRLTFVPLDASNSVPITSFVTAAVRDHPRTAAMRLLARMLADPYYTRTGAYFWDPLAAVAAVGQGGVLRLRRAMITVDNSPGPGMGVTAVSGHGYPVSLAVAAGQAGFERQYLTALNGGRPVAVPSAPPARRLAVRYDGTTARYGGPAAAGAGEFSLRLANTSGTAYDGIEVVVGKLLGGRRFADVTAQIQAGVRQTPGWFKVVSVLSGPPGASPVWGLRLEPGRYALVCLIDRSNQLRPLAELLVR